MMLRRPKLVAGRRRRLLYILGAAAAAMAAELDGRGGGSVGGAGEGLFH